MKRRFAHLLVAIRGRLDQGLFDSLVVGRVIEDNSTPPAYRGRTVTKPVEEGVTRVGQRPSELVGNLPAGPWFEERGDEVLVGQLSRSIVKRCPPDFAPVELRTSRLREDAP